LPDVLSFFGRWLYAELGAMLPATGARIRVFSREGPTSGNVASIEILTGGRFMLGSPGRRKRLAGVTFSIYVRYFVPLTACNGQRVIRLMR